MQPSVEEKRGWMYSITVFVLFVSIFLGGLFLLGSATDITDQDGDQRFFGQYAASLAEASAKMQESLLYLDQSVKYAARDAARNQRQNGGVFRRQAGGGESVTTTECGMSVYPRWATPDQFCPPNFGSGAFKRFVAPELTRFLSNAPHRMPKQYDLTVKSGQKTLSGSDTVPISVPVKQYAPETKVSGTDPAGAPPEPLAESLNWPVKSPGVSSCYGKRSLGDNFHDGIDFAQSISGSEDVYPVADGTVFSLCTAQEKTLDRLKEDAACSNLGKHVIVKHEGGLYSMYNHLDAVHVRDGEQVTTDTRIGEIGNTGRSDGPHLDMKLYLSPTDFDANEGENPFCFYSNEALSKLEAKTSTNCDAEDRFGSPPSFNREYVKGCGSFDSNAIVAAATGPEGDENTAGAGTTNGETGKATESGDTSTTWNSNENEEIGRYNLTPSFTSELETPVGTLQTRRSELVSWAEETWNNCKPDEDGLDAASCVDERIQEYNTDTSKKYTLSRFATGSFACADNMFYREVVDAFKTCLNNEVQGCTCTKDLSSVDEEDPGTVRLSGKTIQLSAERFTDNPPRHSVDAAVTRHGKIPEQEPTRAEEIRIWRDEATVRIATGAGETIAKNTLRLYKPSKDNVTIVRASQNKPSCSTLNRERRETFHFCAQSRSITNAEGQVASEEERDSLAFSMAFKNRPANIEEEDVEKEKIEQSRDDTVGTVQEKAEQFSWVFGPQFQQIAKLTNVILETVSDKAGAAIKVGVEVPEEGNIAGFKVSCSTGLDYDNGEELGFVSIDNPTTEQPDDNTGATTYGDQVCDYVTLFDENGQMRYLRELDSYVEAGKRTFVVPSCQGSGITQLADGLQSYCLKITPVDSAGNQGEPITTCERFPSLRQRIMEQLGVKSLQDKYLSVKEDISQLKSAIESGSCGQFVNTVSSQEEEGASGLCQLAEQRSLDRLMQNRPEALSQALKELDSDGQIERLVNTKRSVQEAVQDGACKQVSREQQERLVTTVAESPGERGAARLGTEYKKHVESLDSETRIEILQDAKGANGAIDNYIQQQKDDNRDYNAEAAEQGEELRELNDLGLTREQTGEAFRYILDGELTSEAREILIRQMTPHVSDEGLQQTCESVLSLKTPSLRNQVSQYIDRSPSEVKQRIWERTVDELPRPEQRQVTQALEDSIKDRLLSSLSEQVPDGYEEALQSVRNGLFSEPGCPLSPFEDSS